MTAHDIQRRLLVERYRRSFCLPNYTPVGWWECDVFEMTTAGYFVEYEIKLTTQDFKADGAKTKDLWRFNTELGKGQYLPGQHKHTLLAEQDPQGPSRFYFVAPAGVAVVPEWSGLIECRFHQDHAAPWNVSLAIVKEAPRLHKQKADPKIMEHARTIPYWRFLNNFCHKTNDHQNP